jgi:hypothetical protein
MFPITLCLEFACLVVAFFFLSKERDIQWQCFKIYLLFITILEMCGWAMWFIFKIKNHWLYNLELIVTFCFITWFFTFEFRKYNVSKTFLSAIVTIFFSFWFYEIIGKGIFQYAKNTAIIRSILFLVCSCTYYFYLLKAPEYIVLSKHSSFWIISGVFFFYFCSTLTNLFFSELVKIFLADGPALRHYIYIFFNLILYGLWAYAFKCRSQQRLLLK